MSLEHTTNKLHQRWMIEQDLPAVLSIASLCSSSMKDEDELLANLSRRSCKGMIAELDGQLVGYFIYVIYKDYFELLDFVVDPEFRRQNIGFQMGQKLIQKLKDDTSAFRATVCLRETNLKAQLLFKKLGFKAIGILKAEFDDSNEDGYFMQYELEELKNDPATNEKHC